jgi:DNA-binding XRE family transcriptional regulator
MSVSRQTINSIETGRYTPSLPLAMALARFSTARWRRSFMETTMHRVFRSRWWMPAFTVALGVAILVAAWAGGDPRSGRSGWG